MDACSNEQEPTPNRERQRRDVSRCQFVSHTVLLLAQSRPLQGWNVYSGQALRPGVGGGHSILCVCWTVARAADDDVEDVRRTSTTRTRPTDACPGIVAQTIGMSAQLGSQKPTLKLTSGCYVVRSAYSPSMHIAHTQCQPTLCLLRLVLWAATLVLVCAA